MTTASRRAARSRKARKGAAMLVVMLVLLAATAGATFAVHATTMDLRSAGFARQATQTKYIGETGAVAMLDLITRIGPQGVVFALTQMTPSPSGTPASNMFAEFGEPPLSAGKANFRVYYDPDLGGTAGGARNEFSLSNGGAPTLASDPVRTSATYAPNDSSLGRARLDPRIVVDLNDHFVYQMPTAGGRSDGRGNMYFLGATVTSHGRTELPGVARSYDPATASLYRRHETASDARAQLIAGPFMM